MKKKQNTNPAKCRDCKYGKWKRSELDGTCWMYCKLLECGVFSNTKPKDCPLNNVNEPQKNKQIQGNKCDTCEHWKEWTDEFGDRWAECELLKNVPFLDIKPGECPLNK